MLKSDLHPPHAGPNADPVLFGVAAGLAELFPPVRSHTPFPADEAQAEGEAELEAGERD